jgi:hypothetical protein
MFKIIYNDGSSFIGGNPQNSKWNNQPNKSIKRIEYSLLSKKIVLEGFESYNHLVEKEYLVLQGRERLAYIYLMGQIHGDTHIYKLNLKNGLIKKEIKLKGTEWKGTATTGWKEGLKDQEIYTNLTE